MLLNLKRASKSLQPSSADHQYDSSHVFFHKWPSSTVALLSPTVNTLLPSPPLQTHKVRYKPTCFLRKGNDKLDQESQTQKFHSSECS